MTRVLGYAIYESGHNGWERSLIKAEKPVEVMARWEKQRTAAAYAESSTGTPAPQLQFKFVMKKHLFIDLYIDLKEPVEKELLYHQLLYAARNDRYPISETEAVSL